MRIIWAIDAFEDNKELNQKMADFISHLYRVNGADVQPLYLLRENEMALPNYDAPAWVADHSRTAENLFRDVLSDYNLPFLKDAKVITHSSQSNAASAETLSNYAIEHHADLIVVGSHGRSGLQRFLLGSFAESLLLESQVPVCIIGNKSTRTSHDQRILFPTEFGEHSKENFKNILTLAKNLNSEVVLLHGLQRPLESLFELETRPRTYNYNGQMMRIEQLIAANLENQSQKANEWVHWAQDEGVFATYHIDSSFRPIDELILEAINLYETDLVAMEAQSGPMSAAILGSYTRNVARKAPCPVYVLPRNFYFNHSQKDGPSAENFF